MKKLTTDEIKKIQIEMLKKFADYCDTHNLEYFLCAGTLLGAIRHKGYIPWDDDIDVAMDRETYEKFYELMQKDPIDENIDMVFYRTCKTSNAPHIKLVDTRTDGHEDLKRDEMKIGVFIDVFPIDYLPESDENRKEQLEQMKRLDKKLDYSSRRFIPSKNPAKFLKRLFIYAFYHHYNYNDIARQMDELSTKYKINKDKPSGKVGILYCNILYSNVIFDSTILVDFEQYKFKVPKNYHICLTEEYGDYMTPPPPEKRVGMHFFDAWYKE